MKKVKIMTILGTRPEIIRLSIIIKKLDILSKKNICKHIIVHTGQNYSASLSKIFFQQLAIREADYYLGIKENSFAKQIAQIFAQVDDVISKEKPDRVLVLGDTNSALSSIIAERRGIPVFHMEAGNRCFDLKVPEENNRKLIDTISSFNLPYTLGSRENLLAADCEKESVFLTGNPIYEVLKFYQKGIQKSNILDKLELEKNKYILVTIHRSENVDFKDNLSVIIRSINKIHQEIKLKVIFSVHPRTEDRIKNFGILNEEDTNIYFNKPFGFFDFIKLEKNAALVLTDSGTVQEECCLFHIPTVTIRDSTERPETVNCGSNIVSGIDFENILRSAKIMINSNRDWSYPDGYIVENVSDRVINILFSSER